MGDYFNIVISKLGVEELSVLARLHDNKIKSAFQAIKSCEIQGEVEQTDAIFRKTIAKLTALSLIDVVQSNKSHAYFITQYGEEAINKSLEGVE